MWDLFRGSLDLWLSRGAHIIYFLHIAPQSEDIAKIQEVFESSTSQIKPVVKGSIRLVAIKENPETEEILEKSKTNHFLLVDVDSRKNLLVEARVNISFG